MVSNVFCGRKEGYEELVPLFVGGEQCEAGHSFGPYIRDYHLIHICLSGCGELENAYGTHKVSAGELFVIRKGELTTYRADLGDPWKYVWIAFRGKATEAFSGERSVYQCPPELESRFCRLLEREESAPEAYMAFLYDLIYHLFAGRREKPDKLHDIRRYIRYNYMESLEVSELAARFGFDRSHLYRLFKNDYGIGIKEYITGVRMERAKEFLLGGHSVCDTAFMVGYRDEFNFSKAFKKYYGKAPSYIKGE